MQEGRVSVIYYTDPLCCWSWAMEPQWRKFAFQFKEYISWRYCLSGLIPDWNNFVDDTNTVMRPSQLGPLWMQAHHVSGMPIDPTIWHKTPPSSSFPACIATKCAFIQGSNAGEQYLRLTREAVMTKGLDISSNDVLLMIASSVADKNSLFSLNQFVGDYNGESGKEAFRKDWLECRGKGISRFPSFVMVNDRGESVMVSGYQQFSTLRTALFRLAPHLSTREVNPLLEDYRSYWQRFTTREEQEFTGSHNVIA
jgi:putative protein-disulfide isomerase